MGHLYFNLQHLYGTHYMIFLLRIFFIQYNLMVASIPLTPYRTSLPHPRNPDLFFPSLENKLASNNKIIQNKINKPA